MRASDRSAIAVTDLGDAGLSHRDPADSDAGFLGLSWVLIIAIGAASLGLRRIRLTNSVVLSAQVAILLFYSWASVSLSSRRPVTWDAVVRALPLALGAGIEHMRTQASPMDPDNGVKLIFVTVIGMIMIMTDLLAPASRPAWAIAPPATLFLVPALGLGTDTGVISFCYIAVGYLAILIAEG